MARRPRVLMVCGNAPPVIDGIGDYLVRLAPELARQRPAWGWDWLAKRPRWYQSPVTRCAGVRLWRPSHAWTPRGKGLACAAVRALRPDIFHLQDQIHSYHETDAAVRLASAARGAGAAVVTTLHEYHTELPSVVHTDALVGLSDVVIANDLRTAERCQERTGRAVDHLWWSSATILPGPDADRPPVRPGLVTTFGFLSAVKAMGLLHEALRGARRSRPDLRWRVIGPFHPETDPGHAALAAALEPDRDWVELTGAVADHGRLGRLLAESSAMLLPYADGASTRRSTLHVSWAFGLPVVTTPPDRPTDAVVDGGNCVLVPEPTPAAWASAVGRVLDDPALAGRLRAGALGAADRFSWPRLAGVHLAMYDELLARRA